MIEKEKHKRLVVSIDYFIVRIFKKPCPSGRNIIDAREREFSNHGILI